MTGSRRGAAAKLERIMPVEYSPVMLSAPSTATARGPRYAVPPNASSGLGFVSSEWTIATLASSARPMMTTDDTDSDSIGDGGSSDSSNSGDDNGNDANDGNDYQDPGNPPPAPRKSGRSNLGKPAGEWWKVQAPAFTAQVNITEPANYQEAMASEQADLWRQAMDEEMASLLGNNTWTLEPLPSDIRPIDVKWVYKVKRDKDGNVERYKARLVVKGYSQTAGIDYNETFAPVGKYTTFRALMAKAAAEDLHIIQIDIKTAFLQGNLEEDIYVCQPTGYEEGGPGIVCHLHKPLYGLKQAPRA